MSKPTRDLNSVPIALITSADQLNELDSTLEYSVRVAVDTETNSSITIDNFWYGLRVIALATKDANGSYRAFVVDARDIPTADLARSMSKIKVADGWNANFDDRVLRLADAPVGAWRDYMHLDGILHSGTPGFDFYHGLAWAALRYLGIEMSGKGSTQKSYDEVTDLTEEQVRYAAQDTVLTLWVAEVIDDLIEKAGLEVPRTTESGGRPFIAQMRERGMFFDSTGYKRDVLDGRQNAKDIALKQIATLTGGGAVTLFGEEDTPSWNVESDVEIRAMLNKYAPDAVKAFTGGRLIEPTDKVDNTALKQINHPLATALLDYKKNAKTLNTYGENLFAMIREDGRVYPEYFQGGITATGRLSSKNPNAQNLDPAMKSYLRPSPVEVDGAPVDRVFVYADVSQAEVRAIAQMANDQAMIEVFKQGGDFHTLNATQVFKVNMEELEKSDPSRYSELRSGVKETTFGMPYGLSAGTLAHRLTVERNVPTTLAQAKDLMRAYLDAYPAVDQWLKERDQFISDMADNPPAVDWKATFELYSLWKTATSKRHKFRAANNKRQPSMRELAEAIVSEMELTERLSKVLGHDPSAEEYEAERQRQEKELAWVMSFDAPVVLLPDGSPLAFESRTLTGRRRLFMVPVDKVSKGEKGKFEGILMSVVLMVCSTNKPAGAAIRDEFAETFNLNLPKGIDRCPQKPGEDNRSYRARRREFDKKERLEIVKAFEGKKSWLKLKLVESLYKRMGSEMVEKHLLAPALADNIRALRNQYRNHPIQGLVGDVMLEAMAELNTELKQFRDAFPIQQVHDSLAIECDLADAPRIKELVQSAMVRAMNHWCPDVPAKVDATILRSLNEKNDKVTAEELAAL